MNCKTTTSGTFAVFVALWMPTPPSLFAEASRIERPNFLIVLCDDLGYGDLACYGHPVIQSPNVDRFASEGLRLTSCYSAAPNCSPSRTGLMTGRTPYRVGVHNWIPFLSPMHVPESEITIATLLRDAGYDTCHVGKWHLNGWFNLPGQPQPDDHGFNHWFSTQNNALPNHRNPYNFVRNDIPVGPLEGYAAPLVTAEAIHWLTEIRDPEKPFFLFVCYHEPHEPIATAEEFTRLYGDGENPAKEAHHGNVTQMDAAFGDLMDSLDDQGLRENTFVMFTSDNGPAITSIHPHGSSGPLREKKGHTWDGGIRVPGIIRWPGRTTPGTESDEPVSGVDLLPTLCAIAGVEPPQDRALDGANLMPVLSGETIERERPLYWHFLYASSAPKVAIRDGDWKLLAGLTGSDLPRGADITDEQMQVLKTAELTDFELYNLTDDVGETTELSDRYPDKLAELKSVMREIYLEVREESPVWPAWEWPRYEGRRIKWPPYRRQGR
ncbi:MAG: arylsulfatase [Planctomycetota bacterium]|nr:MAG: arylsulfatase [Planctomycetota bacterium]REK24236.1 MAG: arylsulfatase [Planctomycetota bacterium]REK28779.1 MAG: arylsulfatase [Planctomycetota bacterium]